MVLFFSLVAALAIFSVANYFAIRGRQKRHLQLRRAINEDCLTQAVLLDRATVADDLFPITSKLNLENAKIKVVGGDGSYILLKNRQKLLDGLRSWCERGARVTYVLTCPKHDAIQEFRKLEIALGGR